MIGSRTFPITRRKSAGFSKCERILFERETIFEDAFSILRVESDSPFDSVKSFLEIILIQFFVFELYCFIFDNMGIVIRGVREDFGKCNKCPYSIFKVQAAKLNGFIEWIKPVNR